MGKDNKLKKKGKGYGNTLGQCGYRFVDSQQCVGYLRLPNVIGPTLGQWWMGS